MKFKSDIEVQAGLKDSSGSIGASGQILSSTNGNVSWVTPTVNTVARDVQNEVKAGVAINKGQAVYVTGADGTNIIVGLASNTSEATSSKTLGLLNATVAVNGFADVVQIGRLSGLNTIGAVVGDPVWLGTNGNLIYGLTNKPYAPAHLVFIGVVTRVNANNGEIFITVQNGFELKEIHDVDIITNVPINGDVLGYDGTLWVNKTIAEWLGFTPANASGTTNYVSKFTGTNSLGDSQLFDNGTNVGIGTNLPQATLQVGNGTGVKSIYVTGSGTNLGLGGLSVSFLGFATGTISTVFTSAAVPLGVGTRSTQPLVLGTNNAERMRIDSSGNVGIGTTSPSEILHLQSSQPVIRITKTGVLNWYAGNVTGNNYTIYPDSNNTSAFNITSGGNVGIGTTSPSAKLHISNGGAQGLEFDATGGSSGGGYMQTFNRSTNLFIPFDFYGNSLAFQTGTGSSSSERMRITSSGNVGIGTSSPGALLDVNGSIYSRSGSILSNNFGGYSGGDVNFTTNTSGGANLIFKTSLNERMRITSGGNVGIGTASPNASAILHLRSTTQGFLPPVMRTGERDSIGSPAVGLMIFNEEDGAVQVFTDEGWRTLAWA